MKQAGVAVEIRSIMIPDDEHWWDFAELMEDELDFHETPGEDPPVQWRCGQGSDPFYFSRKTLVTLGYDVERTLDLFREYGGYCDCEVLFNVEDAYSGRREG